MYMMFYGCESLKTLDLSSFDTSKVTDMSSMFEDCYKLASLNLNSFNTQKVGDMKYMFSNCKKLKKLDLKSFDVTKVKDMSDMFKDTCSSNKSKTPIKGIAKNKKCAKLLNSKKTSINSKKLKFTSK